MWCMLAICLLCCCRCAAGSGLKAKGWDLIWNDEFDGSMLDDSKWSVITGNGCEEVICGWGNNEKQTYTREAITVDGGNLVITAAKGVAGSGMNYTSGRLRTLGKGDFLYGRIEVRMRLPLGAGLWPAFWMLPTDLRYGVWAASGEVDIVESCNDMRRIESTLHFGDAMPDNTDSNLYPFAAQYACPGGGFCHFELAHDSRDFSQDFHTFAVEWEPNEFRWSVDDDVYCRKKHWYSATGRYPAPYNVKFHLIFNLAMGGAYSVLPIDESVLPQHLRVDYVRVYQRPDLAEAAALAESGSTAMGPLPKETCPYDPPAPPASLPVRIFLLLLVPGGAALYLALTGIDGLALFKTGWNACNMAMTVGCGASGGGIIGMAFREATVAGASVSVFLYLAQCIHLRAHLSWDLVLQFGLPLVIGSHLGSLAVFTYKAPWLRPLVGLVATSAAIVLLARRLGLGTHLPMGMGASCLPAGRLQAARERVEVIRPATWCAGIMTGFLQGYAGLGGPLIIGYVVATDTPPSRWRACGPAFLLLLDTTRTIFVVDTAAWGSLWSRPPLLAIVVVGTIIGAIWGNASAERTPHEGFQLLVALSLLGCGVMILSLPNSNMEAAAPVAAFWALVLAGLVALRHFVVVAAPALRMSLPRPVSRLYLSVDPTSTQSFAGMAGGRSSSSGRLSAAEAAAWGPRSISYGGLADAVPAAKVARAGAGKAPPSSATRAGPAAAASATYQAVAANGREERASSGADNGTDDEGSQMRRRSSAASQELAPLAHPPGQPE